ncbi:MAG: RNA polymerase sigma factor [Gammaproteobacteria bacterium]|nr:RNA polymerase sigma factor [Gammaproteobacteria bacterium]
MQDDKQALENIRKGGQTGIKIIYNRYQDRLIMDLKSLCRITHEDAQDILQESFIRFFHGVRSGSYRGDAAVYTYLSSIARRECYRFLDKAGKKVVPFAAGGKQEINQVSENGDMADELCYRLCVAKYLDEFMRETGDKAAVYALTLRVKGWSIEEIAVKIGKTKGATKQYLYECRKKIKPYLQPCADDC